MLYCINFSLANVTLRTNYLQNNINTDILSESKVYISYNQSLTIDNLTISKIKEYNWTISGENLILSGKGDEIFNVIFEIPGNYTLVFSPNGSSQHSHDEECNHSNQSKTYILEVLPISFIFNFEKASFSNVIHGGVELTGTELSIPTSISVFSSNSIGYNQLKLISSGVNTSITGKLIEEDSTKFISGDKILRFSLIGSASADTYIMFDIFLNDILINTYYLPSKISN
jgi:hypothetical protein